MNDYQKFFKDIKNVLPKLKESSKNNKTGTATTLPPTIYEADLNILQGANLASFKFEQIKQQVTSFQMDLGEEDVMVQIAMFGKEIIMCVEKISFQNPDLLYFYGTINGQKAQLIQHQSQINFLLLAYKRSNQNGKPHRINFDLHKKNSF